jgi:hypothetical protein
MARYSLLLEGFVVVVLCLLEVCGHHVHALGSFETVFIALRLALLSTNGKILLSVVRHSDLLKRILEGLLRLGFEQLLEVLVPQRR